MGSMNPRNKLFAEVRDRWVADEASRRVVHLTERLGIRKQAISSMATGSEGRTPPWWAIMELCSDLGLEIRLTREAIILTKLHKRSGSLATRKDDIVFALDDDDRRVL